LLREIAAYTTLALRERVAEGRVRVLPRSEVAPKALTPSPLPKGEGWLTRQHYYRKMTVTAVT